jgi:predicted N-acetyltransferase YhbS
MSGSKIAYLYNVPLTLEQFIGIYRRSRLGERRPVDKPDTMRSMRDNANLTVTAWDGATPVGIARCVTDFAYVAYLSDLAVDEAYQKKGIGKELVRQVQKYAGAGTRIMLFAAPSAVDYYPHIGFESNPRGWSLSRPLE